MREFDQFTDNRIDAIDIYDREQHKLDEIRKKTPKWVKFIAIFLLAAIGLSLVYLIFVHPINKLKLRFLFCDSFTLEIIVPGFATSKTSYIYVDGNIMKYGNEYYEIDEGEIYTYYKNYKGEWQRQKSDDFANSENTEIGEKLLKRSNYKRAKGRLFAWEIKDEVDLGDIWSAGVERYGGKISIVIYYGLGKAYMRFIDFGKIKLTPPWKE